MFVIAKYQQVLESLGLTSVEQVKAFRGDLVKNHKGRRDILRIAAVDGAGRPLRLFLKRLWKPYKKDGLSSLLKRGEVWSSARQEWENLQQLARAGLQVPEGVAVGEDCGLLWERFSFLITTAAPGEETLAEFAVRCRDPRLRGRVSEALAGEIRKLHQAGLASPDLFARHIFVDQARSTPGFCLIDMARLDRRKHLSTALRARDLAALNASLPLRDVSIRERLRFLKAYGGDRRLRERIVQRTKRLLQRRKFRNFATDGPVAVL